MGSLFGGGSARRAAQEQAAALDRQTQLQTEMANYQTQAMAEQMIQAVANEEARTYAENLLGAPIETVDVTLGETDGIEQQTNDLLGRRRTRRQTYQRIVPTSESRVTALL